MLYFIKHLMGSFIALMVLTGIFLAIFNYTPEAYTPSGLIAGVLIMYAGLIAVGYINARSAVKNKIQTTLVLHVIFVCSIGAIDLIFCNTDLIMTSIRTITFFAALQLGVFADIKKYFRESHHLQETKNFN